MKLRTSFFNPTVLRKDVTRFAPLWGLYSVFMLMAILLIWAEENEPSRFATNAPSIMQLMGIVNCGYGGLCALLLFGDLFQSKMAGSLHAMPMRREGWFLTHTAAGFLFCLVPNSVGAILSCMILQQYCYLAFIWLALMLLQFLFFFGVGTFSTQCAGNKLGAVAVFGLFNLLAVLAAFLMETFYTPVLFGTQTNWELICRKSPLVGFCMGQYVDIRYDNMNGSAIFHEFIGRDWSYLFAAAGVGLGLLGISVLLYRNRQLESAGDFIAVQPVAPVFLIIYTLCVGAVLYFFADQLGTDLEYLFLIIGFGLGVFTGFMLLEKKVNVFQGKKWLTFGALTLAFFLTVTAAWLDPLGITRYVPQPEHVEKIHISPYASDYYLQHEPLVLSDAEDIASFTELHKQIIAERNTNKSNLCLRLRYYLQGGTTVERIYYIDADSQQGEQLETYFNRFCAVTGFDTVEEAVKQIIHLEYYDHNDQTNNLSIGTELYSEYFDEEIQKYDPEDGWIRLNRDTELLRGLMTAIYEDCQDGNMAQNWEFHTSDNAYGVINLGVVEDRYSTHYRDITIYNECKNTIAYLKSIAGKS